MRTSFVVAALASILLCGVAQAASTDGSRSDSTWIVNPDHSKVPNGSHYEGDTATARSGSRSDSTFIPTMHGLADYGDNHALVLKARAESGYNARYDRDGFGNMRVAQ